MSTTSSTSSASSTPAATVRNGVPVDKLFGTINKVTDDPSLAQFRFTARNDWLEGTASRSTIHEWAGAGGEHVHVKEFSFDADHPTLGHGYGPTPQEYVLHALAGCITAGVATTAAARKVELTKVTSKVVGNIDVRGVLGIDQAVRKGFSDITMEITVEGNADDATLRALVDGSRTHSAVYDMLTGATPVNIEVATESAEPAAR
ncbi:MAG: OsmC family protein [Acidimicrobiia bacterium]|nr:OsmC family protein [Acidimicrobiia bacterium]